VDTLGLPLSVCVTPADMHDAQGAPRLLAGLKHVVPRLKTIWADAAYRGQLRAPWRRTVALARLQPGEQALDVGCSTGPWRCRWLVTLAHPVASSALTPADRTRRFRARSHAPIGFEVAVIEQLLFPDQTFDVVFSTFIKHHLPAPLKRQRLAEIARALRPGAHLVIGDFMRKQDCTGRAAHFHAGGSSVVELSSLLADSCFDAITTEALRPKRFSAFPGAGIVLAHKTTDMR